jgi:hypothetical protein
MKWQRKLVASAISFHIVSCLFSMIEGVIGIEKDDFICNERASKSW